MKLKLKQSLASSIYGTLEPGAEYECEPAEAVRLVVRGVASLADPKDKLPPLTGAERAQILDGRVIVTRRKGRPVIDPDTGQPHPDGHRHWQDQYRPLTAADRVPRQERVRRRAMQTRPAAKQPRAYGPPVEAK